MHIFQIEQDMVMRSETLEEQDIGKWCWIKNGYFEGWATSKEQAEERYRIIYSVIPRLFKP
jgi:hypothetical protein